MTSIQIFRKNLTSSMFGAPVEMRVDSGWVQWRPADSGIEWSNLFEIPQDGADGAIGMPGAPGASVELQEYFGTLQWRHIGSSVWNHLLDLSDITGPQGETGLQGPQGEAGPQGPAGPQGDCGCNAEEYEPPFNLQMNRCGVAVALTLELKRLYQRIKTDPTFWDTLEDISGQVGVLYSAASAGAAAMAFLAGVSVGTGVAVVGGLIGAGIALVNWISGRANDGSDHWTPITEQFLQESLYCVLTRRETVTITADVLREWVGYINDADISGDNDYLINLVGLLPVSYWANSAIVAQPNINGCLNSCTIRTGDWAYQIGEGITDLLNWDEPVIMMSSSITQGILDDHKIAAVPTPLNTLLYTVRIRFGRKINLTGIKVGIRYRQSRDVISPAISILADGSPLTSKTVIGISPLLGDIEALCWATSNSFGYDQFTELTISGTVAVENADENAGEYLHLEYLQLCGRDYAPFGENAINTEACDECEPENDFCSDIVFTNPAITGTRCFDFRESTHGWTVLNDVNGPWGTYVPGVGFQSLARRNNPGPFISDVVQIFPPNDWVLGCALASVAVEFSFQRWTAQGVDFPAAGGLSMPPVGRIHIDGAAGMEAANGIAIYENVSACPHNSHLGFRAWAGYSYSIRPNTGNVVIHSIKIGFNGNFMPTGGK